MSMWYDRFSVAGKTVFLTGAAGGIGSVLLEAFLEAGARVFALTRRSDTDWKGLDKRYPDLLIPQQCDLGDQEDLCQCAEHAEARYGVDVFVHAASDCPHEPVNFYSLNLMRQTMRITFEAAYLLCSIFAPGMAARGAGSIIHLTTMNAEQAWPGNPAYITAKSALRMLTRAVARDFGERGVRANNLCPGYVHTRLTEASFSEPGMYEERRSHTMLGRWGVPDDMVGPCLFLASDASRYITGLDLHVEGGWLAKGM